MVLQILKSLVRQALGFPVALVPYDKGQSKIEADLNTALGLRLYRYGHREPEIDLVRALLSPGDIFIDGGTHVGLFTLVAARKVGASGKVISFEPAKATRERLLRNIKLNQFSWVDVKPLALSDQERELEFISFDGNRSGFSSFSPEVTEGGRVEKVKTVTLDSIISSEDVKRLALIKLDLEGAELLALRGAEKILKGHNIDLLIEVEPEHLKRQGTEEQALQSFLKSLGYEKYYAHWNDKNEVYLSQHAKARGPNIFFCRDLKRVKKANLVVEN